MIRTFKIDDSTERGKIFISFLTAFGLIETESSGNYVLADVENSFNQVKLMKDGKLSKQTLNEFLDKL